MWSLAAVALALLAGHNRSEGSSRFVVGDRDVQMEVSMLKLDLPELCEVDLSFSDAARRDAEAARLRQCVEVGMPRWLRLHAEGGGDDDDDGACVTGPGDVVIGDDMMVTLRARASCGELAGRTLVIDWGFFAGQGLDHLSKVSIVVSGVGDGGADAPVDRTLFSKRQRKARIKVPAHRPRAAVVAAVGVTVVVGLGAVVALLKRGRRRSAQNG